MGPHPPSRVALIDGLAVPFSVDPTVKPQAASVPMEKLSLVGETNSIVRKCEAARSDLEPDVVRRLHLLEAFDFGFLLVCLSPRRLLRDGRLFDNEQVLPLLLWFGQWDKYCRYWASEVMRQWLVFDPSDSDFEGADDERAVQFRNHFFEKHAIPLIEEFRQFVAQRMIYPNEQNAPSGAVEMIWHSFILNTDAYWRFRSEIWLGGPDVPSEGREEQSAGGASNAREW